MLKYTIALFATAAVCASCANTSQSHSGQADLKANAESRSLLALQDVMNRPKVEIVARKAVSNAKLDQGAMQAYLKTVFVDSKVTSMDLSTKDYAWTRTALNHHEVMFTDDSPVWAVTVEGDLDPPFPCMRLDENGKKQRVRAKKIVMALSVEDGTILAASATPI